MSNKKMDVRLTTETLLLLLLINNGLNIGICSDITPAVFGSMVDGMPAAFGDFNSDELTDVFVLTKDLKTLEILLASDQEPLLYRNNLSCSFKHDITNVVPGDYDGDVSMDVLVTTDHPDDKSTHVYVLWGGIGKMTCANESDPLIVMHGEPLAIDYNQDMIIDLFGLDLNDTRTFWVFNNNRTKPNSIPMERYDSNKPLAPMLMPHSNAFLDLNNDYLPDLMITTQNHFEIWHGTKEGFKFSDKYPWPPGVKESKGHIGQALYLDFELKGQLDLVVPVCFNHDCSNSSIFVYNQDNNWYNLPIEWRERDNVWGFVPPANNNHLYSRTITLRGGDFNMDGYPDLLATLRPNSKSPSRTFLLLNEMCPTCINITRTFKIKWTALSPFYNETVLGVFYDFYQDGILDVILVVYDKNNKRYTTGAFKNSIDYDTNFVKVMVLTGLTNSKYPISPGSLGKKKRTYGTNLPGPSISYETKTQDGYLRNAIAAQLPQSAYFSLNLPYTTFGLDRMPNYIDKLTIGVAGKTRYWQQVIPNSQIVVIPNPINDPSRWRTQLFVTPSKLILLSAGALAGTCVLISAIIIGLYWKERREDKIERLQEAHRFHFDAM